MITPIIRCGDFICPIKEKGTADEDSSTAFFERI
jgi:hypothetical protein